MIVLVANLGSTSYKYKLFRMEDGERVLASGQADRIGLGGSNWSTTGPDGKEKRGVADLADHDAAICLHNDELVAQGALPSLAALDAIGFKAVHGGPISGAVRVDERVRATMADFADVAPAHNPPYLAAMAAFARRLPDVPQVAAFETAFHQTVPLARQAYAIPYQWTTELGIRRYGFHGASHRWIATRLAELSPRARRVVSCHLGGSSSLCAIENGVSRANSFGMTLQTGLPQAARAGDFDTFALLKLRAAGLSDEEIFARLGSEGGLAGISGVSSDLREIAAAAAEGHERARLALDVFVEGVRHYLGAYLAVLGGVDAVAFTGGIGQHAGEVRRAILTGFDFAGLELDEERNAAAPGSAETRIDATDSRAEIWVLPTNEELIVARQTVDVLNAEES